MSAQKKLYRPLTVAEAAAREAAAKWGPPLPSLLDVLRGDAQLPVNLPRGERGEADIKHQAFAEFQRDLSTLSDVAGAFLAPKGTPTEVLDYLGALSVCVRLGSPNIPVDALTPLPKVTDPGAAGVLVEGGATVEPVVATFGSINPSMRCVAAFANVTRGLRKISGEIGSQAVEAIMFGNIARKLDAMAINGTGADGEFLGILDTPGVPSISGAAFSKAKEAALLRLLDNANLDTASAAFAAAPDAAEVLRAREVSAGSGRYFLDGGEIGGRVCIVSNAVPSGTLILGLWSELAFLTRSVELTSNPYSGAKAGSVEGGVYWHGDAIIRHAGAFAVATGVS